MERALRGKRARLAVYIEASDRALMPATRLACVIRTVA
jgi:hypothetical protein